ncbi:hypothetical protein BAUCODRAFT_63253 [Baudoinia panamericana UAMH 10762]|uniref:Major facilitator superfamily (MFS) profile domain-containing protein n=1 Tax=Baudoinia panamericana (strain UAMH 10762) TaxID=717646 RepID=M2MSB4_BAUPA|nr:uncharacterized protein BAUCODRAFT_63253 [Baudoinia panamericana UAMH 10762]EMC99751.1 hypothetical protein BAUCODRAFT_63253 [Baudoinia panamericana UAMH 10762]
MRGQQDDDTSTKVPASAYPEREIDSAATTLIASAASSKSHSFDERRKYADIELEKFDAKTLRRDEADERLLDHEDDDDERHEHTLADETATLLNTIPEAAETARVDEGEPPAPPPSTDKKRDGPISWSALPAKDQLAILTLARLAEPLAQTSLQAYMFYQLKSFHAPGQPPPSDDTVARQAGILSASFAGSQFLTAIIWGRLADSAWFGRKRVILIGVLGTAIGTVGFGFSSSFAMAVFWRCMGGMLNGNIGVMRTMISEIVREKKYQSRAFLLMPMTFNIGVIIGPLLGGLLADPVGSYPHLFGENGGGWLRTWPYALPNVVNAVFLFCGAMSVLLGLDETHESRKDKPDFGRRVGKWIARSVFRRRHEQAYEALAGHETAAEDIELEAARISHTKPPPSVRHRLPFRRIWTTNVLFTLVAHGLLAMHVGTFNNIWFVFLSTPRYSPGTTNNDGNSTTLHLPPGYHQHLPFTFTGGLALPPPSIGTSLAILGVIGISLQLLLYPTLSYRLGTLTSFRGSLLLFPFSYLLAPYLAMIPSINPPPGQASGALVWIAITVVLLIQVTARTFALPSTAILVNNSSPHPSVLGTVHGIAQTVSSATRTVGPALMGWIYGIGLQHGVVGTAWWSMTGIAVVGAFASLWVREGSGHEIWLEGEMEEEGKG